MKRAVLTLITIAVAGSAGSCSPGGVAFLGLPIETRFAFTNFSLEFYATVGIREHLDQPGEYSQVPLLPPGATFRGTFLDFVGSGCPDSIDLQLLVYRRVNNEIPIGLDEGEAVEATPVVAGETLNVPACSVQTLETYTIVVWETEEGVARVKIAQDTAVDSEIRDSHIFEGIDATWQIDGVDPAFADTPPPAQADSERLAGRVTLSDGSAVEGIGVLLRTRFRLRLNDADVDNDPDAGFGGPIAVTSTDETGAFSFDRPPGAYQVEFFSDDFAFRPDFVVVESPIDLITSVAEPL